MTDNLPSDRGPVRPAYLGSVSIGLAGLAWFSVILTVHAGILWALIAMLVLILCAIATGIWGLINSIRSRSLVGALTAIGGMMLAGGLVGYYWRNLTRF